MLSSLQGTAVTAIKIDNVLHEFSSINGVREDVTDIVLNVKSLALNMHSEGVRKMSLNVTGPGEITAGMINTPSEIDIINPELVICNLDDNTEFNMELHIKFCVVIKIANYKFRVDDINLRRCIDHTCCNLTWTCNI